MINYSGDGIRILTSQDRTMRGRRKQQQQQQEKQPKNKSMEKYHVKIDKETLKTKSGERSTLNIIGMRSALKSPPPPSIEMPAEDWPDSVAIWWPGRRCAPPVDGRVAPGADCRPAKVPISSE